MRDCSVPRRLRKERIRTAHITEVVGKASELTARLALMCNGWATAKPDTDESYDIVAKDPVSGEWATMQVKTVRVRHDRGRPQYVIDARKGDKTPYSQSEADYVIGVMEAEGVSGPELRVWLIPNSEQSEYWAADNRADRRWHKLPLTMDRAVYEGDAAVCPAA